jgi:hypothetical protein
MSKRPWRICVNMGTRILSRISCCCIFVMYLILTAVIGIADCATWFTFILLNHVEHRVSINEAMKIEIFSEGREFNSR